MEGVGWKGKNVKTARMNLGVVNTELVTETTEVSVRRAGQKRQLGWVLRTSDGQEGLGWDRKGKQEGTEVAGKTEKWPTTRLFLILFSLTSLSSFLHSLLLPHPTQGAGGGSCKSRLTGLLAWFSLPVNPVYSCQTDWSTDWSLYRCTLHMCLFNVPELSKSKNSGPVLFAVLQGSLQPHEAKWQSWWTAQSQNISSIWESSVGQCCHSTTLSFQLKSPNPEFKASASGPKLSFQLCLFPLPYIKSANWAH